MKVIEIRHKKDLLFINPLYITGIYTESRLVLRVRCDDCEYCIQFDDGEALVDAFVEMRMATKRYMELALTLRVCHD